jgi:large subunit ribosomal protein L4e
MKATVVDTQNQEKGSVELPFQFSEPVRQDLIYRAVVALQSNKRQKYGTFPEAGLQHSIDISKRRRDYKGVYGVGISRTPRKILSRSGSRMNWVGARAPQTVKGRRAHPPKAEKVWQRKINDKERRKAIRSAIAATMQKRLVEQRGHMVPEKYPFIVDTQMESLSKTRDVERMLETLGFSQELQRASIKNVRAGKGKSRGRKYRRKTGPLLVVSKKSALMEAAKNIPGVDVVEAKQLNAELLAPGCVPGRATLWSAAAIESLSKEKLFG